MPLVARRTPYLSSYTPTRVILWVLLQHTFELPCQAGYTDLHILLDQRLFALPIQAYHL